MGDDRMIDSHDSVVPEERLDRLEFVVHVFELSKTCDLIVLEQRIGHFAELNAVIVR